MLIKLIEGGAQSPWHLAHFAGDIVNVEDKKAQAMIEAGVAEPADESEVVETAESTEPKAAKKAVKKGK